MQPSRSYLSSRALVSGLFVSFSRLLDIHHPFCDERKEPSGRSLSGKNEDAPDARDCNRNG
jgi:hypothetical protein